MTRTSQPNTDWGIAWGPERPTQHHNRAKTVAGGHCIYGTFTAGPELFRDP